MEQILISKKELLEKYSISYGALYRWKRKGLIPEDWFIKKATVTGQETFFPRDVICERVELILNQKEDFSLDALSKQLNEKAEEKSFLIINTVFGEKRFSFADIRSVLIERGSQNKTDITKEIFNDNAKERK